MPQEIAHAAKLDDTNTVVEVIMIPYLDDDDAKITAYCNSIGLEGRWIDTSWTGARRGYYAGPGWTYDPDADVFVPPPSAPVDVTDLMTD